MFMFLVVRFLFGSYIFETSGVSEGQGDSEEWKQYRKTELLLVGTLFPVTLDLSKDAAHISPHGEGSIIRPIFIFLIRQ